MLKNQRQDTFHQLTEEPVEKLVLRLSVPTIISMLVTAFYNMADTFFVGRLQSNSAVGAVGVVFSLMAIIQACGFFFGHGSGNYISRMLGGQQPKEAAKMAATGFFSSFLCGLLIMIGGLLWTTELARLLGATETILPYAEEYLRYILFGAPFMTAALTLNNQLRFQGRAMYGMIGIITGGLLNLLLDPLFIFVLDFGVGGAAMATVISQICSFCILLAMCCVRGNIRMSFRAFTPCAAYYKEILLGGSPSLLRQGLSSVAAVCLNRMAGLYGDAVVAGMAVVNRIMMFAASALLGFGQGFQPVCGFNFGAGQYDRIRRAFWFCIRTAGIAAVVLSAAGYLLAPQCAALFRDDPAVIMTASAALRWQCVTFPLTVWIVLSNMMMQNLGMAFRAMFLSLARQGLFFVPLVLLLPRFFDLTGVEMAQAVADIFAFLTAVPLQIGVLRELHRLEEKGRQPMTPV